MDQNTSAVSCSNKTPVLELKETLPDGQKEDLAASAKYQIGEIYLMQKIHLNY
jgi:hypothetical protein